MAIEFAPEVRVNGIAPGVIVTEAVMEVSDGNLERYRRDRLPFHPVGRLGKPEDIAGVVSFLVSDDAAFMTGVTIPVDGGLTSLLYRGDT